MTRRKKQRPTPPSNHAPTDPLATTRPLIKPEDLRDRIVADFATLRVPLTAAELDTVLARAEREGLTHLQVMHLLVADQARQRRERSIARRIGAAKFQELKTLVDFDWHFNAKAIDRTQIEELATCAFIRRKDNLVLVGQSGVGKSRIVQAVGQQACVLGHRVCYTTSGELLLDLKASLADQTLPRRLRHYAGFDLLIIDEFGFDKLERDEAPQAANLFYKIIDARYQQRSTALITNLEFDAWGHYLGDPPLAMALLDRLVDGAIIVKIAGKSYRAHRGRGDQSH
jgi:DNA replication protein DnaC